MTASAKRGQQPSVAPQRPSGTALLAPLPVHVLRTSDGEDDLCHTSCEDCYPDGDGPYMCGKPDDGIGWTCDNEVCTHVICVVCDDLALQPCERCGL